MDTTLVVTNRGEVASDGVEGKGRRMAGEFEFTGNKAQFDEGLEAVADAQGQTVSFVEKLIHGFLQHFVAENCRNEFAAAVRLVAGGETAGEHDDLGMADAFCHFFHRFLQFCRVPVSKDENIGTAPARSKALALSTSQLLPGMVGMNTRGLGRLVWT